MIDLPKRERPAKSHRQEEQANVEAIIFALNSEDGVWACQNKDLRREIPGKGWISLGPCMGEGSADVIFSVYTAVTISRFEIVAVLEDDPVIAKFARIGWLECKTHRTRTKRVDHAKRDDHQIGWANAMRKKGHFVAHGIVTVADALAAVDRCMRGAST